MVFRRNSLPVNFLITKLEFRNQKTRATLVWLTLTGLLFLLTACAPTPTAEPPYRVVLDHLEEPRGLWLTGQGTLCVAEAGGLAEGQAPGPSRQARTLVAETGAVTCLDRAGRRQRIVEHLPHVLYSGSGESIGPTAVAQLEGRFYVLTGEGFGDLSRKLLGLAGQDEPLIVADFVAFAAEGRPLEYVGLSRVAANPYAMIPDPANRRFLVTDGALGQVLAAGLDGHIEVYSPVEGHEVLTGIAWGPDGLPYVASFSQLPHEAGQGAIVRLRPGGKSETVLADLTTPIDLAFDQAGRLYVLEFIQAGTTGDPYRGKTGRLLRFARRGERWGLSQVLVEDLPYPTALLFGPDDTLYISIHGAFSAPHQGRVLRFDHLASNRAGQFPLHYRP